MFLGGSGYVRAHAIFSDWNLVEFRKNVVMNVYKYSNTSHPSFYYRKSLPVCGDNRAFKSLLSYLI